MTSTEDIGPGGLSQAVQQGADHADIIVVNATEYLRGNYGFLTNEMGVPATNAGRYANEWISLKASSALPTATTFIADVLNIADPTRSSGSGAGFIALSGVLPPSAQQLATPAGSPATLDVSAASPFYPSSLTFKDPQAGEFHYVFTNWGEKTSFVAPPNAVVISGGS